MIERCFDAATINSFANHPEIIDGIGGPADFTNAIRETTVFLFGEHGGFCFEWSAPDTYEVHVMLTKAGRGKWGCDAAQQALRLIGAGRVWARIAPDNRPLQWFARHAGFREVEQRILYAGNEPAEWRIFEWSKV